MELVNEWLPNGKFRKADTPFSTDYTHEKDIMEELPLTVDNLRKAEMEYYGKFEHNFGKIQHISLMSIIYIFYTYCSLSTENMAPTLPGFQGIKL